MENSPFTISEIQISYNPLLPVSKKPRISSSVDAQQVFRQVFDENLLNIKEEAAVLYLNRGNRVVGAYKVSSGGITGTIVDTRLILGIALKALACNIMLAHTHPSGELKPSRADLELTAKLKEAAKFMDITLLDHLIISLEGYYSFADEGIL